MEFTYNGMVRYGFGFANPNHAAVLITMLIVVMWAIRLETRKPWLKYLLLIFELFLYTALFYTYSRSGIIALAASALLFWGTRYLIPKPKSVKSFQKKNFLQYVFYTLAVLSVFFYSGISNRIINNSIMQDKSIGNRFDVWQGGLKMLIDMPLGTGTGLSGKIYTLFYLPVNSSLGYRTLINSFLTFWVEQGVITSSLLLLGATFTLAAAWYLMCKTEVAKFHKRVIATCLSVILAGTICGILSTCFDISLNFDSINNILQYLTFVFWLSCFTIIIAATIHYRRFVPMQKLMMNAGLCFIIMVIIAFLNVLFIPKKQTRFICPDTGFIATADTGIPNTLIIPDFNTDLKDQFFTMSKYFKDKKQTFVVSEDINIQKLLKKQKFDIIVLYGESCSLVNTLNFATKISLFCPEMLTLNDEGYKKNIDKVYLKYYDENGNNFLWENYLKNTEKIVYIK